MMAETYWNGERCVATKVTLKVTPSLGFPNHWTKRDGIVGEIIDAVEVVIHTGNIFYLDDRNGEGWLKVTEGKGSPIHSHKSLDGDVQARAR